MWKKIFVFRSNWTEERQIAVISGRLKRCWESRANEKPAGTALRRAAAESGDCAGAGSKPAIVLADEPTGNLDSRTSQDVLGLLKVTGNQFKQTIVMITHNEEIAQMADRIIRIEDGKILERR